MWPFVSVSAKTWRWPSPALSNHRLNPVAAEGSVAHLIGNPSVPLHLFRSPIMRTLKSPACFGTDAELVATRMPNFTPPLSRCHPHDPGADTASAPVSRNPRAPIGCATTLRSLRSVAQSRSLSLFCGFCCGFRWFVSAITFHVGSCDCRHICTPVTPDTYASPIPVRQSPVFRLRMAALLQPVLMTASTATYSSGPNQITPARRQNGESL